MLVFLDGEGVLESWDGRRWNSAFRELGSAGATAPRERDRLQWRTSPKRSVRTASIYLPEIYFSEAREEFRRVGEQLASVPVSVLRVQDRLHNIGGALVAATEAGAPDLYAQSAAFFLAKHLLVTQRSCREASHRTPGAFASQRAVHAIDYMRSHLPEPISLLSLAQEAGVSPFHFARMFKDKTGSTPAQYLTALRMRRAQELLTGTDMPISSVGQSCGYTSASAFSAAVRRHLGGSPIVIRSRRYRQQIQVASAS